MFDGQGFRRSARYNRWLKDHARAVFAERSDAARHSGALFESVHGPFNGLSRGNGARIAPLTGGWKGLRAPPSIGYWNNG